MKVISYDSRILNPQEQKLSTLDREFLGIVHALQTYEFLIIGTPHPIHIFTNHKHLLHCFTKKGNLSARFHHAQMQLTKFSKLNVNHTPGKKLSVADMLSRSFTKTELQLNQLKHKQIPPQIDFAILQNNSLTHVHYLIQHEEVLPHQKHDSHPIFAVYGTHQFPIRINDKGNDIIVKPLDSFSFKFIIPFQNKYKTLLENITNLYINNLYFLTILKLLVMMMIIYTLVFQTLLHFHPMIKPMIHIEHPLFHVQPVILHSQKQNILQYQFLSLIQLNL